MKLLYRIIFVSLINSFCMASMAQQGCSPSTVNEIVTAPNAEAHISVGQLTWSNLEDNSAGYETPVGSGLNVIYSGGLWIGGLSPDNEVKMAAETYGQNGNDFFPGPLSAGNAETISETCMLWDRIIRVERQHSVAHLQWANATISGVGEVPVGYEIPEEFFEYPAHGNVSLAQNYILAPFYDFDGDGFYDPSAGDCPLFEGMGDEADCISCDMLRGDVAYFSISNDKGNIHSSSGGDPIGVEIRNVSYTYLSQEGTPIDQTTYYQKKIINQGTQTLHDTYISIFVDADIGGPSDDYVGCNVERNLGYIYNGDAFDDSINGVLGYGENPPAVGVVILKGPPAISDGIDNDEDGIIDNETLGMTSFMMMNTNGFAYALPDTPQEYYNYMRGLRIDGSPITYGTDGINEGSELVTSHIFPDDGNDGMEPWTEINESTMSGDRKMLISMGPFDLVPGQEICINFAVVIGESTENTTAIESLHSRTDYILDQNDNCNEGLISTVSIEDIEPNNSAIVFDSESSLLTITSTEGVQEMAIVNSIGQLVTQDSFTGVLSKNINLSNGVYIVRLKDERGQVVTKKIVL